jgi:hypothetical protein
MEPTPRITPPPGVAREKPYALLLALVTTSLCAVCWWYPQLLALVGIGHGGVWFRDTLAVLAAIEVHRQGLDPYAKTVSLGNHNYSHWWFWLEATGLTRRDTLVAGLVISGSGLLAGWYVARPRSGAELGWMLAVFCSAPVLLGLDRGNVDVLLFALMTASVPAILSRHRFWRIAGAAAIIALATGLKFYPAAALPLLFATRPGRDRQLALGLGVILLGLTAWNVAPDIARYAGVVDHEGFYVFGAPLLAHRLDLPGIAVLGLGTGLLAVIGLRLARSPALRGWSVPGAQTAEYLWFILGALILTACFLLTVNYAYRWIFALGMIPFLCRVPAENPALRRLAAVTRALLVVQLWFEVPVIAALNLIPHYEATLRLWEKIAFIVLAGVSWSFFACLAGWLGHFVLTQARITPSPGRN